MALVQVLQDDFSSYADGTEIRGLSQYTVSAFNASELLVANGSGGLRKQSTGQPFVTYANTGSLDQSVTVVMGFTPSSSARTIFGPALRVTDWRNYIALEAVGSQSIDLMYANSGDGSSDNIGNFSGVTFVAGDTVTLAVENDVISLTINGTTHPTTFNVTGESRLQGQNAGFVCGLQNQDPWITDLLVNRIESVVPIAIDNHTDDLVVPILMGETQASFDVSGTYTGSPETIEYRLVAFEDGSEVTPWAILDAAPASGTFSGTITHNKTNKCYIAVRFSSDNLITVRSNNRISFGYVFGFFGQSNVHRTLNATASALASNTNTVLYDEDVIVSSSNKYVTRLLNSLQLHFDCTVAVIVSAADGSSIQQHLPRETDPQSDIYLNRLASIAAAGGKLSGFIWGQGETNAGISTEQQYYDYLGDLLANVVSTTSQPANTLPMFIVQLGRNEGETTNDIGWSNIRRAQTRFVNDNTNVYMGTQSIDLDLADTIHRSESGHTVELARIDQSIDQVFSGNAINGRGPIPTNAVILGNTITIEHDLNGSTLLTVPANAHTLYQLSIDDFTTIVQPTSSTLQDANKIVLTFASIPAGTPKIRSFQTRDVVVANIPTGNLLFSNFPTMVEPITTELVAGVAVTSDLSVTISGMPDGAATVDLFDSTTLDFVSSHAVTFTSGTTNVFEVTAAAGSEFRYNVVTSTHGIIGVVETA